MQSSDRWSSASLAIFVSYFVVILIIRLAKLQRILPPPPTPLLTGLIVALLLSFFLVAYTSLAGPRTHDARIESGELQIHLHSDWISVSREEFEQNARGRIRRTVSFIMAYQPVA